jgi:hypothetical protein
LQTSGLSPSLGLITNSCRDGVVNAAFNANPLGTQLA